jgi:hypothetical protein
VERLLLSGDLKRLPVVDARRSVLPVDAARLE